MVNAALKNLSEEEGGEKRRGREKEERRGEKREGEGGEERRERERRSEDRRTREKEGGGGRITCKKKKDFKLNSQPALGVEGSQTGVEENCCQETL